MEVRLSYIAQIHTHTERERGLMSMSEDSEEHWITALDIYDSINITFLLIPLIP